MDTVETVYDYTAKDNKGRDVAFEQFRGDVLLIVNTASKCGFTPQYSGLEELNKKYGESGLVVMGFPCDQFANQEPGGDDEIASFCELNFGVTFRLMKKVEVNGPNTLPLFQFLKSRTNGLLGSKIKWNFTKFLVAPDGRVIKRYGPIVKPQSIEKDIVKFLDLREK